MSKVKEGTGISCNDKRIKENVCSGNVFEYSYDKNNGNDDLRYGSNQGMEINNSKEIFVSSEIMKDYVSQETYSYRLNSEGNNIRKYTFKESNIGKDSRCEIEGLQVRNGMMYFAVKNYDEVKNKHFIYKIDIDVIG